MSAVELSAAYSTPTKRAAFSVSDEAGPSRARPAGTSPAYISRRHSLYGAEDRVVIDPGSRIWKIGFSGEPDPRGVYWAQKNPDKDGSEAWALDLERLSGCRGDRKEATRLIGVRVVKLLKEGFVDHLLTDAKQRKVIVVENTYLPIAVKEQIAAALFDNLRIPSISFTPASVLALAACGRVTSLVVDCGWLETTVTPVYHSRPLLHLARSTPIAGRALHRRLRTLLHHHATYLPPPKSLSSPLDRTPIQPVPLDVLTDRLVERVLTEGCFVGPPPSPEDSQLSNSPVTEDVNMEVDEINDADLAVRLKLRYASISNAKTLQFRILPRKLDPRGMGPGTLQVPGWIRERAAEILFANEIGEEEESLPEVILNCLLKLPIDLRPTLISTLLISGGTPSLPGFIPRLRISLQKNLLPPPSTSTTGAPPSPLNTPASRALETREWRKRHHEPYRTLYGLAGTLAILNDPAPLDGEGGFTEGRAPRWNPSLLSWIGGSLAGSLKSGSLELTQESYDTNLSHSLESGEAWKAAQEETRIEISALMGVELEALQPGMAVLGLPEVGRRRGWRGFGGVGDWSRTGVGVGAVGVS